MQTKELTLKNGLRIVLIDTNAFPTLTTLLMVGAGSRYETKENNGIAHFFEHIPFKGTKRYPSSYAISATMEGIGGMHNAYTTKDHTAYWAKAPREHFDRVLDILSDMILQPLLDPYEIEKEKGVIVEEINMYEDIPHQRIMDILSETMYAKHPLGMPITGTKKTVRSFTQKTFSDYMNAHYHPSNVVIAVAGGLKQEPGDSFKPYLEAIDTRFSSWNGVPSSQYDSYQENQKEARIRIYQKQTEQAHFALGFPTVSYADPRKYAVSLLATILGGTSSSRLFMELREGRGLCYYVSAFRQSYEETGEFVIRAGVPTDPQKLEEAVVQTVAQCVRIREKGVTEEELKRAKEYVKGQTLINLEDSSNVAEFYSLKLLLHNEVVAPSAVLEKIMAVTADEIRTAAQDMFQQDKLNLVVIGPYESDVLGSSDFLL